MSDEVDVWVVPLDRPGAELERLYALLAPSERERAGSFPLPLRKRRYAARQGMLREILARYTGEAPEELRLVRGDRGKPTLARGAVCFSVSDSHDLALVAVGRRAVGVDVERVVDRPAARRILPAAATLEDFYIAWTRLEAAGKATGEGLLHAPPDPANWRSWRIDPAPGFAATLVAAQAVRRVAVRTW
jgi:4'-phosphopantetheinyl transferase